MRGYERENRYIYLVERPVEMTMEFMDLQGRTQRVSDAGIIARVTPSRHTTLGMPTRMRPP